LVFSAAGRHEWWGLVKTEKDEVRLVRVKDGKMSTVKRKPGVIESGQWYEFKVLTAGPHVCAYIDNRLLFRIEDTRVCGGRVGLYAQGKGISFDDVFVIPCLLELGEVKAEKSLRRARWIRLCRSPARVAGIYRTRGTMRKWSSEEGFWERVGRYWMVHTGYFFNDTTVTWTHGDRPFQGILNLVLFGGKEDLWHSGFRCIFAAPSRRRTGRIRCCLDGRKVFNLSVDPGTIHSLRVEQRHDMISLWVNGRKLREWDNRTPRGWVAFARYGAPADGAGHVRVRTDNLLDYTFSRAPVDWYVAAGRWGVMNRWKCAPEWSWFGGYSSTGNAVIWNKNRFPGDIYVRYFVAARMASTWGLRYPAPVNFGVTVAGDGKDITHGYSLVYGFVDMPSRIMRNGEVVAENREYVDPAFLSMKPIEGWFTNSEIRKMNLHRRWFCIEVAKRGNEISMHVNGKRILFFKDPRPVQGDHIAFWTRKNGMLLARVRVYYERMILEEPWRPCFPLSPAR